jgi:putative redox protein
MLTLDIFVKGVMTKTTPSYFASISVTFKILGQVSNALAIKACEDSMTKYCGVSYMLSKVCSITYDVELNGIIIFSGLSKFDF